MVSVYGKPRFLSVTISTLVINNRTQAVRLPAELRFPEGVTRVEVRVVGNERIVAPADHAWDSFSSAAYSRARISWLSGRPRSKPGGRTSECCPAA